MKKVLLTLLASLSLMACGDLGIDVPDTIIMQNPTNGQVAPCHHDNLDVFNLTNINRCVDGYKNAGWIALPSDQNKP